MDKKVTEIIVIYLNPTIFVYLWTFKLSKHCCRAQFVGEYYFYFSTQVKFRSVLSRFLQYKLFQILSFCLVLVLFFGHVFLFVCWMKIFYESKSGFPWKLLIQGWVLRGRQWLRINWILGEVLRCNPRGAVTDCWAYLYNGNSRPTAANL